MRNLRAYVLLELGELVGLIVLILVLAQFIHLPLWLAVTIPAGKFLKFLLVYPAVRRSTKQPAYTGMESLIGEQGFVVDPLNPEGYVKVRGELWRARSEGLPIPAGTEIEVHATDGIRLLVGPRVREDLPPSGELRQNMAVMRVWNWKRFSWLIGLAAVAAIVLIADAFLGFIPWHKRPEGGLSSEPSPASASTLLRVCLYQDSGTKLSAGSELPEIHLYQDGRPFGRLSPSQLQEGCGSWLQIELGHRYFAEAYLGGIYSGKSEETTLAAAGQYELKLTLIPARAQQVRVFFSGGTTPLPNALVIVYTHTGLPWASACTDALGLTPPFRLQPTTREEEYYRIEVLVQGELVATERVRVEAGRGASPLISLITTQEPGPAPGTCASWL
ncbi:MAG: NfeD family protein [Candidatus Bipolaricaulia bacterium]